MAEEPAGASGQGPNSTQKLVLTTAEYSSLISSIFEDCLYNIIHDNVLAVHREEKLLRMASVAVLAEAEAQKAAGVPSTPTQVTPSKPNGPPLQAPPQVTVEIPSGRYENGRVYLKENPLKKLDKNYCPHCKLPRLKFPLTGANARPPDNLSANYCTLHPYIQKPGHDIYGNPFPIDQSGKTKKERELIKRQERMEKDNTPGSQDTTEDGIPNGEANLKRLMAGGKPASYVPWHTCPSCKRSLLITKFAQHLEKCLGIGGRAARNAAAVRLSAGVNGSASGSVQGSRVGTPQPSSQGNGKRDNGDEEDGDNDGPPKKKAKTEKKKKDKENGNGTEREKEKPKEKIILKMGSKAKPAKDGADPPSKRLQKPGTSTPSGHSEKDGTGKRARDESDEGDKTMRKKMKLARENSTQSLSVTENGVAESD